MLWACDPCTDCGPISREPTFKLLFANVSGLQVANDSLAVIDTLIVASGVLDGINVRIEEGEEGLEPEKLIHEQFIDGFTELRSTSENLSDTLSVIRTDQNALISDINNGVVLIDKLTFENTGLDSVFTDSAANYAAPLDLTSEETELTITIAPTQYSLLLTYELFDEKDLDHQILRKAQGITIKSHSFDSVLLACDSANFDCDVSPLLSNETIITCYF